MAASGPVGLFGFPLGLSYFKQGYWIYRNAFHKVLRDLVKTQIVESNAPLSTEIEVTRQPGRREAGRGDRTLVHIVNFSPLRRAPYHPEFYEDPIPLTDVSVRLNLPLQAGRARAVVLDRPLETRRSPGGGLEVDRAARRYSRNRGFRMRSPNTLRKLERMNQGAAPRGAGPRADQRFLLGRLHPSAGGGSSACPPTPTSYYHYDLDWIVTVPNMDPWIRPFETIRETAEEVVVKTGFGAIMHKHFEFPMPEMRAWEIDTFEKLERAEFDDPRDRAALLRGRRQPDRRRGRRLRSATRRRGSRRSSRCGRTSRSTAA